MKNFVHELLVVWLVNELSVSLLSIAIRAKIALPLLRMRTRGKNYCFLYNDTLWHIGNLPYISFVTVMFFVVTYVCNVVLCNSEVEPFLFSGDSPLAGLVYFKQDPHPESTSLSPCIDSCLFCLHQSHQLEVRLS